MSNILLVAVDPAFGERVSSLTGHHVVAVDAHASSTSAERHRDFRPDVVFVGTGVPIDRALTYASSVSADWPDLVLVLVSPTTRRLARRAERAGFEHVIDPGTSAADLERLAGPADVEKPADAAHRVVVVASPKGGVGKTTTAVNLTGVLAAAAPWEVVLVDLDLQFGDASAMLGLTPQNTVVDALSAEGDDSMFVRTLLTIHPSGFYLLAGADGPADGGGVTGDQVRKLVSQLSTSFRYVVVDTSAGLLEETLASLEEASDLVMVTALDVATLRSTHKELDVLGELGLVPAGRHLLLNRAHRGAGLTVRDAERMLDVAVPVVVPRSDRIGLAANHGTLAIDVKDARVRKPFDALAAAISGVRPTRHSHRGEKLA
ncbi:AAA family ATPase [Aeromicrobium endophyticum]|uniref:MinD/ParA family protein n=1 Tax=Aeromicrobium endophyticum TaxID=2292704 RepID=A0A371PD87_9ACTN|nr:AAA family ATPase [Aeromicrobium endophyticum]REK73905.1 MinD/ParA family protein [Aeromicrobium endophyticum]